VRGGGGRNRGNTKRNEVDYDGAKRREDGNEKREKRKKKEGCFIAKEFAKWTKHYS